MADIVFELDLRSYEFMLRHVAWKHAFFSSLYTHELISSNGISSLPVRCVKHELISSNGISSLPVRCAKHALISSMESLAYQPKHEILFITSFENSHIGVSFKKQNRSINGIINLNRPGF